MIRVIDASIAVKWFAPDGDDTDDVADRVLARVAAHPREHAVPELFVYEVLAVLCRRLPDADAINRAMRRLDRLGVRRVRQDPTLVDAAAHLAKRYRITGYDAAYAALAQALGGRWVTLDAAAHARLGRSGLSVLAR